MRFTLMGQKDSAKGKHISYNFYHKWGVSVLPESKQAEAEALLNRFVCGEREAFEQFKLMFERHEKSRERDLMMKDFLRTYKDIGSTKPSQVRSLCDFLAYHRIERTDSNAAQAAFAFADVKRSTR